MTTLLTEQSSTLSAFFHDRPRMFRELCKVVDKGGAVVPFVLQPAQADVYGKLSGRDIILKARQLGFCVSPSTRVLMSNLVWKQAKDINPGESIVGVDENTPGGRGPSRKMQIGIVEAIRFIKEKAYKVTLADGRVLVCTGKHRWLTKKAGDTTTWRSIESPNRNKINTSTYIRSITEPWGDPTYEDGWFGGILDGEGSLAKPTRTGTNVNVSQVEGLVWERIKSYLYSHNYHFRIEYDKPERPSKYGKQAVNKVVVSRTDEVLRLVGHTRPSRFIEKHFWDKKELPSEGWVQVVDISPLGEQIMVDLQTSTKTFIAEGFVSHNSSLVEADFLLDSITLPNLRTVVIVQNEDAIPKFSSIFHNEVGTGLYDFLPEVVEVGGVRMRFKPDLKVDNVSTMMFDNGSIINVITSGGVKLGRGQTIHRAHLTEVAFWDREVADTVWAAVEGAMPPRGSKLIVESTAFGQQGKFFHEYVKAKARQSIFRTHFYPWWWGTEYRLNADDLPLQFVYPPTDDEVVLMERYGLDYNQLLFRRSKMASLGVEFQQEYPETDDEAFIGTGNSIFTSIQRDYARQFIKAPLTHGDGWSVWEEPKVDGKYVVAVDSSQGTTAAADYDVIVVLNVKPPYVEHVATWMGRETQRSVAERVMGIAEHYNKAVVAIETVDGSGQTISYILRDVLHYPRQYMDSKGEFGWKTTRWTKPGMIDSFKELLDRQYLRTPDERVASQMTTYVERVSNNGTVSQGSSSGAYDDLLCALMIGAAVLPQISRAGARITPYGRKRWR